MKFHYSDNASIEERFWAKVDVRSKEECWPWLAAKIKNRYGGFSVGRRDGKNTHMLGAHRFSLELKLDRELSVGEEACHTCDNPICCNPNHLYAGDHTDNMRDIRLRDRIKGDKSIASKISEQDVEKCIQMRRDGMTNRSIAKLMNMSESHMSRITRGIGRFPKNLKGEVNAGCSVL